MRICVLHGDFTLQSYLHSEGFPLLFHTVVFLTSGTLKSQSSEKQHIQASTRSTGQCQARSPHTFIHAFATLYFVCKNCLLLPFLYKYIYISCAQSLTHLVEKKIFAGTNSPSLRIACTIRCSTFIKTQNIYKTTELSVC